MFTNDRILAELQMITGIVTEDADYLVACLLRDNPVYAKTQEAVIVEQPVIPGLKIQSFDEWFNSL